MSIFGAIVKTVVNVVKLPIELPVAVVRDAVESMADCELHTEHTNAVVEEIKEDAES